MMPSKLPSTLEKSNGFEMLGVMSPIMVKLIEALPEAPVTLGSLHEMLESKQMHPPSKVGLEASAPAINERSPILEKMARYGLIDTDGGTANGVH